MSGKVAQASVEDIIFLVKSCLDVKMDSGYHFPEK
jgi:hypothetical protein